MPILCIPLQSSHKPTYHFQFLLSKCKQPSLVIYPSEFCHLSHWLVQLEVQRHLYMGRRSKTNIKSFVFFTLFSSCYFLYWPHTLCASWPWITKWRKSKTFCSQPGKRMPNWSVKKNKDNVNFNPLPV